MAAAPGGLRPESSQQAGREPSLRCRRHSRARLLRNFRLDSATIMGAKEVADHRRRRRHEELRRLHREARAVRREPVVRFARGGGRLLFPPPRVDSHLIRLNRRVRLLADGALQRLGDYRCCGLMADAAFTSRRKTIAAPARPAPPAVAQSRFGRRDSCWKRRWPGRCASRRRRHCGHHRAIFDATTIDSAAAWGPDPAEFLALSAAAQRAHESPLHIQWPRAEDNL